MVEMAALQAKVLAGGCLLRDEAAALFTMPLAELCAAARKVQQHFHGSEAELCTIINIKNGGCSEDCAFCAQSSHYHTVLQPYPMLRQPELLQQAAAVGRGVLRCGLVAAGRRLSSGELTAVCRSVSALRQHTDLSYCISFGLLTLPDFLQLKAAGVMRVHCNLETSRRYFSMICHTHTYDDKLATLAAAREAGLELCSGGILGIGESRLDRVDMALQLRALDVRSVPVNFLHPIAGTPCAQRPGLTAEEAQRSVAVLRLLLPQAVIRLAGGRGLMADKGLACFQAGADAAITGDMLTTGGISRAADIDLLHSLGKKVADIDG